MMKKFLLYVFVLGLVGSALLLAQTARHEADRLKEARHRQQFFGEIADAGVKLQPGQVYKCVTPLFNAAEDGKWYAIVWVDNDSYLGLRFAEKPPIWGVTVKQDDKIIFWPVDDPDPETPSPVFEGLPSPSGNSLQQTRHMPRT